MTASAAPRELRVSPDRRTLTVVLPDGASDRLTAEMLRVLSPSAEVQGHSPEQRKTIGGKANVAIADIRPIGNYAVRIVFDDGHDSGLFTWSYLADLGERREALWQAYLDELKAKGLSRER
ncbi:DUF971 domain-containing protein [Aurantimonas sp. Leaf443]|uniref:gamma-butyrobetaine hydroxylase-like domain-containing protein n=1 Tax=Aurantimonas sp. Leaf443 TaxID=1736378 RepID=UPI0006FB226F|nr:DUF971 domain-containing protein [Aurantimonas sp. Leaf443]KQT86405.1 hypothetical protein ASG48_06375 [Aurantimonas sp. Leaf443]